MISFIGALVYVGWSPSWRSLFIAALVVGALNAAGYALVHQIALSELATEGPRMALGVDGSVALFLVLGTPVMLVRKHMIENDQREMEAFARTLESIHRPKDGGAA